MRATSAAPVSATTSAGPTRAAAVPPQRRRSLAARRRNTALVMLAPALLGLAIFFVYPLLASVYYSFTRYDLLSPPQWIGLRNYTYLFTEDPDIGTAALNTLWFVVILVPVRTVVAMLVAGLLSRARSATGVWRTVLYLPALVPPVASVVVFVFLFNPGTGPVATILHALGIQSPLWFNDPLLAKPSLVILGVWVIGDLMIIFLASMLEVPRELYEAAGLDGADGPRQVRYITLPTIAPVIGFAVVTGVIAALQYFTEAAVASGVASGKATVGEGTATQLGYPNESLLTYTEYLYTHGFAQYQLGYASAMAVVLFVVSAVLLALTIRRISVFRAEES